MFSLLWHCYRVICSFSYSAVSFPVDICISYSWILNSTICQQPDTSVCICTHLSMVDTRR